uniref:BED-type domain-containing protein n=1 Tax=Ditylenchus dipsaci TaxID=166011 RepID=A0A915D8L2_9BILA
MLSIVWKHFKKVGNKAVCDCGKEISLGKSGTTTGCLDHLNTEEHKEAMRRKEGGPIATKKAKVESVATLFSPNYSSRKASS